MIVLALPDGTDLELSDSDARHLCELLWRTVEPRRPAAVAVDIYEALLSEVERRRPIDVSPTELERIEAALDELE
jgi:hypothetical protein